MTQSGSFADPTDSKAVRESFISFYKDRWDSYIRSDGKSNWKQLSKYAYLTDEKLISVVDGQIELPMAFNFDSRAKFVVLLIDVEDKLGRATIFDSTMDALSSIGYGRAPSYIVNELGHIHLYLNFDKAPDHGRLKALLDTWLRLNNLETQVRVLGPSELIEIPLQPYFTWIKKGLKAIVRRRDIALDAAISMFMTDMRKSRLEYETFIEGLSKHVQDSQEIPLPVSFASLSGQIGQQDRLQDDYSNEENAETQEPVEEDELSRQGEADLYDLSRQSKIAALSLVKNLSHENILDFTPDGITPVLTEQDQEGSHNKLSSPDPEHNVLEESGQPGQDLFFVEKPSSKSDSNRMLKKSLEDFSGIDLTPFGPQQEREPYEQYEAKSDTRASGQQVMPGYTANHFNELEEDQDDYSAPVELPERLDGSDEDEVLFSPEPVSKTMLPPPGATSFNQLMIPFSKNNGPQTISDNFKDWRGPP